MQTVCRFWWRASRPRSAPCWRYSAIAAATSTRWRVAIAASCTERELIQFGGRVGSTLYALSREPAGRSASSASHGGRKPITLSTKPLSTFKPIEDEVDDEDFAEAVTA